MIVIVGLGNPEARYANTRHNVGFLFVDELQNKDLADITLFKPTTGMNNSGSSGKKFLAYNNYRNYNNLYVAHDDLDIKLGDYKIQFARGPKCHHGIESIEQNLGTKKFWRLRLGVDNRQSNSRISGESYVLQNFTNEEKEIMEKVIEKAVSSLEIKN